MLQCLMFLFLPRSSNFATDIRICHLNNTRTLFRCVAVLLGKVTSYSEFYSNCRVPSLV